MSELTDGMRMRGATLHSIVKVSNSDVVMTLDMMGFIGADLLGAADEIDRLTVWRPMSTAPRDETPIIANHKECVVSVWWLKSHQDHILEGWYLFSSPHHIRESSLLGWLPLPEAKP